jgi:flagellum-specific peptidoglycan hydrolase FlgJ
VWHTEGVPHFSKNAHHDVDNKLEAIKFFLIMNIVPLLVQKFLLLLAWLCMMGHASGQTNISPWYAENTRPSPSETIYIPPLKYRDPVVQMVKSEGDKPFPNQYSIGIIERSSSEIAAKYQTCSRTILEFWQAAYDYQYEIGIPASIVMAIAIKASSFKSQLYLQTGNPFGIKASNSWDGPTYLQKKGDTEISYRVYGSPEEAVLDLGNFIHSRWWYADALACPFDDIICFIDGLKADLEEPGYALDPNWNEKIIQIIIENDLDVISRP